MSELAFVNQDFKGTAFRSQGCLVLAEELRNSAPQILHHLIMFLETGPPKTPTNSI